jgi:hypothetical protein
MPPIEAEEAGIWALYEHRRVLLGLPESVRPAFLVAPSGDRDPDNGKPSNEENPEAPAVESAESQTAADFDPVVPEAAKSVRFGFGARPRA